MKNIEYPANIFKDRRVMQLLSAALISLALIGLLILWCIRSEPLIGKYYVELLIGGKYSTGLWTLVSAVIFSPVAFILWYFRDQNQQLQIENHRKDINLKDFQKLCEWASGLHLVEEKVTVNQKTNAQGIEKTETIEQSRPPVNSSADTTSRRDGSIGLQIAAVYQLRAFIEGDHGEHFIRPALLLLLALWEGLMDKHLQAYRALNEKSVSVQEIEAWKLNMSFSLKSLFGQALCEIIFLKNGKALESQKRILVNKKLICLYLYSDHSIMLDWNGVNLEMSNIFCCGFSNAKLTKCIFSHAKLNECNFTESKFVDCDFDSAKLENCRFEHTNIKNRNAFIDCSLNLSRIKNSFFHFVDFHNCSINVLGLINSQFVNCSFKNKKIKFQSSIGELNFEGSEFSNLEFNVVCRSTKFYRCIFKEVYFNTSIINGLFNVETRFEKCEVSSKTKIGVYAGKNYVGYFGELPIETHALRLRLRDTNGLILNPQAYTDYADKWNKLSEVQQKDYYDNAYKNANQDDID